MVMSGNPHHLGAIALLGQAHAAGRADGRQRIVVDVTAGQRGHRLVEQPDEQPGDARLGLAALAEEDDVLAAEDGVLDLRDDGVFVAHDAGQERSALAQARHEIVAQFLLHRAPAIAAVAKLSDRARASHEGRGHYATGPRRCQHERYDSPHTVGGRYRRGPLAPSDMLSALNSSPTRSLR
jgi:hypothetical protein